MIVAVGNRGQATLQGCVVKPDVEAWFNKARAGDGAENSGGLTVEMIAYERGCCAPCPASVFQFDMAWAFIWFAIMVALTMRVLAGSWANAIHWERWDNSDLVLVRQDSNGIHWERCNK